MSNSKLASFHKTLFGLAILILITMSNTPSLASADRTPSFVHLGSGNLVNEQGMAVYLDGVNYKDQLNWYLYEEEKAPDWSAIRGDFASMGSMGAKVVRVWFNWLNYERTPGGLNSVRLLSDMQKIVNIAKQNGLYVILTIYVYNVHFGRTYKVIAKNWLQADATSSKTDPNSSDFWLNNGDYPSRQRGLFVQLWRTISASFKNEPTVAMYDLMNEPFNKYYDSLPLWVQNEPEHDSHYPLKSLFDQAISAIRGNGDNHLVLLDYNWVNGYVTFPAVRPSTDPQVMYDVHLYYTAAETPTQGWDIAARNYAPWSGRSMSGTSIAYTYPDTASGHDISQLSSRFAGLVKLHEYAFYVGEFGFTENTVYSQDIASLVAEFRLSGFAYFEYVPGYASLPDWPWGTVGSSNVTQTILAKVRQAP
ncbi:MAG: cellulase family glycosylhydrolase [Candidatus Bathyarchaeia archaeon]